MSSTIWIPHYSVDMAVSCAESEVVEEVLQANLDYLEKERENAAYADIRAFVQTFAADVRTKRSESKGP